MGTTGDTTRRVALTVDAEHPDRPAEPGGTERVLDVLAAAGVRATFFVQGRWAEAYPNVAGRIGTSGHRVGNHSYYHARTPLLTDAGLVADLAAADEAIAHVCGVDPRPWVRLPFGAGADDPAMLQRIAALGYRHVGWHVDSDDWEEEAAAELIASTVVGGVADVGDGAVALFHGWPTPTADGLRRSIEALRSNGWSFVTIDELPGDGPPVGVPWGPATTLA
ncbi:MAG: polysaccharide deacetylase family protein [Chloroflexota bacterium]